MERMGWVGVGTEERRTQFCCPFLPDLGQECYTTPVSDLLDHLAVTTELSRGEAERVVAEVTAYFAEPTEALVRRRHRELQAAGLANPAIFERIGAELGGRLVAPPTLSVRQLRRIVYG